MDILTIKIGTRVEVLQNDGSTLKGTIQGHRINGLVEGRIFPFGDDNMVSVLIDHINVPPETIEITCYPRSIIAVD